MKSNETVFASLTKKVEEEYALKEYRQQELKEIEWRNYERMYQELQTAKRQFDDSDEDSDAEEDDQLPGSGTKAESGKDEDSDIEDISFGGMFVNKLKQEGNEVVENKIGGKDVFYDVVHIVGGFKEKRLPAKYIRKYNQSSDE
ncbi:Hypothetical protein PHPALM_9266 [Phytophthora palmivora]|uniref:Uncharacterized protein n=1 Tax=Phytophthora palmivora TaxID=4796 RepID=A0A2P4Y7S2_9STRA|nr:Hypothetical protein PHPALM_9266 [Phytophthora palmivora]